MIYQLYLSETKNRWQRFVYSGLPGRGVYAGKLLTGIEVTSVSENVSVRFILCNTQIEISPIEWRRDIFMKCCPDFCRYGGLDYDPEYLSDPKKSHISTLISESKESSSPER